jgi:ferredoxin
LSQFETGRPRGREEPVEGAGEKTIADLCRDAETRALHSIEFHCLLYTARSFSCYNNRFGNPALFRETDNRMTYVIAEPCIGTKDTACVDACPVDCIHPKKDSEKYATEEMLYIDPVECIDCGACVPVCPVSAIFALDDLPEKWNAFTERNAKYFGR